jgi:16S rRNA (uracil1498-N3)-methyltransferase
MAIDPRFWVENLPLSLGDEARLTDGAWQHLKARRLRIGESITLFDGKGKAAEATLHSLAKHHAIATVRAWQTNSVESPLDTRLILPLITPDKMDFAIQKAVELGVREIIPVIAQYSQSLPRSAWNGRHQHWQGVIRHACEQCGRNTALACTHCCH